MELPGAGAELSAAGPPSAVSSWFRVLGSAWLQGLPEDLACKGSLLTCRLQLTHAPKSRV